MIPVLDSVKARRTPFVNVAFIVINIAVFISELTLNAADLNAFFLDYGIIPAQLDAWASDPEGIEEPLTVVSATFIHGGWLHLGGNMLFLWVFGDNIEDALGHVGYFIFYFVCAAGAAAAQVAFDTGSLIPVVGASGAVAGVLGAYLVLYPRGTITVLVPFFFFIPFPLPAFVLIVFWFLMQLMSGVAAIGTTEVSEGIAFWAHVGGFVTGLVILFVLRRFVKRRPYGAGRGGRGKVW